MKNTSVILNVVLIIAVAILFVLHFTSNCKPNTTVGQATTTDSIMVNKDIAYVQIDSLVSSYDMYHDLKSEYENEAKKKETEFVSKTRSFQRELEDYQEKATKGLITRSQAEQMEQGLQRRQQDLEVTGQKMRQELAEKEGVMMRQIYDAIMKYVTTFNETRNYSLILSTSGNATVLYGHPSMNITGELIIGLNEEYIKNRSGASSTPAPAATEETK